MANRISLAGAIKSAAQSVTGETTINDVVEKRNHANSRISMGPGPNVRQANTANTITTAPNFYSPFLTPSSFQIPNARREVYLWANWWKNNEPKVAAGINFYATYPFAGWKLECSSTYVKDYFEKLIEVLNFQKWLPEISKVYYLLGDAFVLLSIDCPHCNGSNWDEKHGKECEHDGATWKSVSILNPDSVLKSPGMIDQQGSYSYRPSAEEVRIVTERSPKEIYDSIPDGVKRLIQKGEPIKLNPISIHHFKYGSNPWEDYGTSMIRPLFQTLTYKDKLRQAQYIIAERLIVPVKVVKIGSDTRPASQEDIDNVQDELSSLANDPNLTLVTHHNFDLEWYGAGSKIYDISSQFELIENEILDGLMLSKVLITGEGPAYSAGQVGLLAMEQRIETWRHEVANWIEQKIFKPVAQWNGFVIEGERGQEEIIYPTIKFKSLELRDETNKLQTLVTANQNGVVSNVSLIEAFGLDVDQEIERLRFEQGANFMKEQDYGMPQFSMNIQSGPVTGQGFGAMTPGAPPPMAGGEMAGLAPPLAASKDENYRIAASIINSVYNDKMDVMINGSNKRIASTKIKSFAHEKFIKSFVPVSGRGQHGKLPDEYDGLYGNVYPQLLGGEMSSPLNFEASQELHSFSANDDENIKTAAKKKMNSPVPQMYTSLEKKLYDLLKSLNFPYPLYAQYSAGQTMDYQLDAAIPSLRIGIEADGEIWHNNPDKISKDKRRDSDLATHGWIIVRFTDKELNDYPQDCMNVLINVIKKRTGVESSGEIIL
jgi:very-short-patch-repair endonuclease